MFIINLHIINIVRKFHAQKIVSILLCIAMIVTLTPCTLLADTLTVTSFTTEVTNTPANGKYFDVGEPVQITMTLIAGTKYSDVYGYDNLMGSTSVLYIDKTNSGNDSKTANYSYVVTAADAYNGYKRRSEEN